MTTWPGDEGQARQDGPLARTAEGHRLAVALGRDRPEQADVEDRPLSHHNGGL